MEEKDKITQADKGMRAILTAMALLTLISIFTAVRFFYREGETYQAYKKMQENLNIENVKLSDELTKSKRQREQLKARLEAINVQLKKATQEQAELKERYQSLLQEKETLSKQVQELNQRKEFLEIELANLKEELQRTTQEKNQSLERIAQMDELLKKRMEELDKTKETLAKVIRERKEIAKAKGLAVELPPIVVKSEEEAVIPRATEIQPLIKEDRRPKEITRLPRRTSRQGQIVRVNDEYNFVIIDLGRDVGVRIGSVYGVYRDGDEIAEIEVIDTREDLAAADIRSTRGVARIREGDEVIKK